MEVQRPKLAVKDQREPRTSELRSRLVFPAAVFRHAERDDIIYSSRKTCVNFAKREMFTAGVSLVLLLLEGAFDGSRC